MKAANDLHNRSLAALEIANYSDLKDLFAVR